MSLTRRIERLEATLPPPPPPDDDRPDNDRWWEAAPEPVVQYLVTICREIEADQAVPDDTRARAEVLHERHPALGDIGRYSERIRHQDEMFTLRQVQREVLIAAQLRLGFHLVRTEGGAHGPDADERTYRRMLGIPVARLGVPADPARPTGRDCYYDRTGETFVRAWRATGTVDPATLAILGLHAAELVLLRADEVTP